MKTDNIVENELEKGNLYEKFVSLNINKIKELSIKSKSKKERDFYNKLYELALQTKQIELIEKGVF